MKHASWLTVVLVSGASLVACGGPDDASPGGHVSDASAGDAGHDAVAPDGSATGGAGGTAGGAGSGGAGAGSGGGATDGGVDATADGPKPDCSTAVDCPAPADCFAAASCVNAACVYVPLVRGAACGSAADKCHTRTCDGAGTCQSEPVVCTAPPATAVPANCPAGTTFKAALGGACNTTCDAASGCVYGTVDVPCPEPGAVLPQKWAYQAKLRSYLKAQSQASFDVPAPSFTFDPNAASSDDDLYRLWIGAHYDTETGNLPAAWLLTQVPSSSFVLTAMESTTPPKVAAGANAASEVVGALFYGDWSYAGNPFRGAPGVLRRIFAMTAADLMLMDAALAGSVNVDDASGALPSYGYVGARIKGEASIDACVRAAYLVGLRRIFDGFEPKNVGNGNGDMLIAQAAGYALMAEALGDAPTRARAAAKATAQIGAICDPAGFCTHQGGGYDPFYEGWTQNHVSVAAKVSGWPDTVAFAQAVHAARAYTSLPQPEQVGDPWALAEPCLGPSEFSPATPWGACEFGGDYPYGRDALTADLDDDALYLVAGGQPGTPAFPSVATMKADLASSRGVTRAWGFASDGSNELSKWSIRHYARGLSGGLLYYTPGTYAARAAKLSANPELAKLPVLRAADYVKALGATDATHAPQLLVAKFGGADPYSLVLHTGFVDTQYAGAGTGGGQLAAFWGKEQGSALLGWNIGRNYTFGQSSPVEWLDWSNWTKWTAHVVSGRSGTKIFSSGRLHAPTASYDLSTPGVAVVTVSGDLQNPPAAESALSGHVLYSRTFQVSAGGVTVDTSVVPSGAAPAIDELYETFPIFMRFAGEQQPASLITFRVRGAGAFAAAPALGTERVNVDAVRITRYGRTVELVFSSGHPMKLVAADTPLPSNLASLGYTSQVLLVNLGASGGPLTPVSTHYTVQYL